MRQRKEIEQERRSRRGKKKRNPILIIAIIFIIFIVLAGAGSFAYYQNSLQPVDPSNEELTEIQVPSGSTLSDIADQLADQGFIKNAAVFNLYTKINGSQPVQAGYYQLSPSMNAEEILNTLETSASAYSSSTEEVKITVPEGSTILQIAEIVSKNLDISQDEFLTLIEDDDLLMDLNQRYPELLAGAMEARGQTKHTLEGYLYPATYTLFKDEHGAKDLVHMMVDKMNIELQPYTEDIAASNLSLHEILSLASIVEMEAPHTEDRRLIAGVFLNRLEIGMPMQTDISILYIKKDDTVIPTYEDLEIDDPYNLYMYPGLGPGPMNNPSIESIDAVLNPMPSDYYFFLADLKTGEVYYAEDHAGHEENISKYMD